MVQQLIRLPGTGLFSGLLILLLLSACGASDASPDRPPQGNSTTPSPTVEATRLTGFSGKATEIARTSGSLPVTVAQTAPPTTPVSSNLASTPAGKPETGTPLSPSAAPRLPAGNIIFTLL